MRLLCTGIMINELLSTSTMAEDADKHKNNAHEVVSIRTMQMRVLSTRTMTEDYDKHKNNANDAAKHRNDSK